MTSPLPYQSLPALMCTIHGTAHHFWCYSCLCHSEHLAQYHVHDGPSVDINKVNAALGHAVRRLQVQPPLAQNSPRCNPGEQCQAWSGRSGRCPGRAQCLASHPEEQVHKSILVVGDKAERFTSLHPAVGCMEQCAHSQREEAIFEWPSKPYEVWRSTEDHSRPNWGHKCRPP